MPEVFHGGGLDAAIAKYGGRREEWLDLSTGINPNPYPIPEISPEAWARLPDKNAEQDLLDAAREYYAVPDGLEIVAAPGTQAIIQALPRLIEAQEIGIVSPTYGEHAHVWQSAGANVTEITEIDELEDFIDVGVVVNPNNPDGRVRPATELYRISEGLKHMIVDEAFCDPCPLESLVFEQPRNAIVLKSFGKFFGLAGLRLGFAICRKDYAKRLREMLGPWCISGAALEIGAKALRDKAWVEKTQLELSTMSSQLSELLSELGICVEGYASLFVYVKHAKAADLFDSLARNKILVRPFPERPDYLRFGMPKNADELKRLINVLSGNLNV